MNNLPLFDALAGVPIWAVVVGVLLVLAVLGFTGARLWIWTAAGAVALYGFGAPVWLWGVYVVPALLFNVPPIRRALISAPLMKMVKAAGLLPRISQTEQTAIEAGTVWPRWRRRRSRHSARSGQSTGFLRHEPGAAGNSRAVVACRSA